MKTLFFLIILSLSLTILQAQTNSNPFLEYNRSLEQFNYLKSDSTYRYWAMQNLYDSDDTLIIGADISAAWQNGAVSHYENYEDNIHYLINPFLHYKIPPQWKIDVRVNLENIRDQYVYKERQFWGDEFREHRGYFDVAKIEYHSKYFSAKLGRDYHQPGLQFYENLFFSAKQYSYDQLKLALIERPDEVKQMVASDKKWKDLFGSVNIDELSNNLKAMTAARLKEKHSEHKLDDDNADLDKISKLFGD